MADRASLSEERESRARRYLPHALLATAVVAVLPVALVWGMRAEGVVSSPWLCLGITIGLSLAASITGNAYWRWRPGSDLLFSELLLWGWLRRVRIERQLDRAAADLGLNLPVDTPRLAADPATAERTLELLSQLAAAMEAHDPYIDGHSRRVARHATGVARKLGLADEEVALVANAASVHDVGKLRLPREILMKAGALTDEEFEVIKRHSTEGASMVACLGDDALTAIVRHHHERLDGSGYPAGLHGQEIPLGARIIAVADTFDAITSARPYRPAARHQKAIDILEREAGTQLDPDVVSAFVSYYSGSRVLAMWSVLGALPQRALHWVHRFGPAPQITAAQSVSSTAATLAVTAAAIVPPAVLLPARHAEHPRATTPQLRLVADASVSARIVAGAGDRFVAQITPSATPRHGTRRSGAGGTTRAHGSTFFASFSLSDSSRHGHITTGTTASLGTPAPPAGSGTTGPAPTSPPVVVGTSAPPSTVVGSDPNPPASTTPPASTPPASTPPPASTAASPPPATTLPAAPPVVTSPVTTPSTSTTGSAPGGTAGSGTGSDGGGTTSGGTPPPPPPPPAMPTSIAQCMHDAWNQFGFGDEAQCGDYVLHGTLPSVKPTQP